MPSPALVDSGDLLHTHWPPQEWGQITDGSRRQLSSGEYLRPQPGDTHPICASHQISEVLSSQCQIWQSWRYTERYGRAHQKPRFLSIRGREFVGNTNEFQFIYRMVGDTISKTAITTNQPSPKLMTMTPNKSPEPTAVGACSSAIAVHVASRRWLSFFR